LDEKTKEKIALFANMNTNHVISDPNLVTVYDLPLIFKQEGLMNLLGELLDLDT